MIFETTKVNRFLNMQLSIITKLKSFSIKNKLGYFRKGIEVASLGIVLMMVSSMTVVAQQNTAPSEVRIDTLGRDQVHQVPMSQIRLSEIEVGDERSVFENCDDGDFYLAFQLYYDLGDQNTQTKWVQTVEIALLQNGVEIWRDTLKNSMESQLFLETVFHEQTITCTDNYTFKLLSKSNLEQVPEDNLFIRVRLYKKDQDIFNPYQSYTVNAVAGSHQNEFRIDWTDNGIGVEHYELEWVFIDSLDGFAGTSPQEAFQFKQGVSISTAARYYSLQSYYPGGIVYFRVRSIGVNPNYPNYKIPGEWQYCDTSFPIANHNTAMNWQVVNSFAEDGKSKNVMSYMDGSMRQRQLLTNLNTDENILIAESLYDFEGRPVVSILPTPFQATDLNYRTDFNGFDESNGWDFAQKFHYDNDSRINSLLDSVSGAASYYSANNSFDNINTSLIPRAEGYAYTQSQYKNDNTGRMNSQSGVGSVFNIDDGKNTKYFYAEATTAELTRLFGSNVGDTRHYRKNAVMDPNGQVSISYVDQEGRTIATALAGESPQNLDTLTSLRVGDWSMKTIDIADKGYQDGSVVTHSNQILNTTANTGYDFTYSLSALAENSSEFGCIECRYDLEIFITTPKGELLDLPPVAGNESSDDRYFRLYDFSANDCSVANSTGDILLPGIVFQEVGTYNVVKKLTAKEMDFEAVENLILSDPEVLQEIEQIRASYPLDSADCEFCNTCDQDSVISATIGEVVYRNAENIYNQIVEDLRSLNTGDTVYTPTEEEIQAHELYCKYEFYLKNAASDSLEAELALINDWDEAVSKGYDNLLDLDPFFNREGLSGYLSKSVMEEMLDEIWITTMPYDENYDRIEDGYEDIYGPLDEIIDYYNYDYYIDDYGNNDYGYYHILYRELQFKEHEYTSEEFDQKLSEHKWTLYKTYYFEQKRQVKAELEEVYNCPVLANDINLIEDLPTEKEQIEEFGQELGITGAVNDDQIAIFINSLQQNCGSKFSTEDSTAIAGHLKVYFDRDTTNLLEFIDEAELEIDSSLVSITSILENYSCGIEEFAIQNPITCLKDTTVELYDNDQQFGSGTLALMQTNSIDEPETLEALKSAETQPEQVATTTTIVESPGGTTSQSSEMMYYGDGANSMDSIMLQQMQAAEEEILERIRKNALKSAPSSAKETFTKLPENQNKIKGSIQREEIISTNIPFDFESFMDSSKQAQQEAYIQEYKLRKFKEGVVNTDEIIIEPATKLSISALTAPMAGATLAAVPQTERDALIAFYNATNGDNWTNITPGKEWKQDGAFTDSIGNWEGVTLNVNDNVTKLSLVDKNLTGYLPTEIGDLNFLTDILLDNNHLSGTIPEEIYSIDSLTRIVLSNNSLTGNISSNVGNLTKLHTLWLDKNNLTDSIPDEIGLLTNLESLLLNQNNLSGTIPESIGGCVQLNTLWLANNQLSGKIPAGIGGLINLDYLMLSNNLLSDTLPGQIGSCNNLRYLYIQNNNLSGPIPDQIGNLSNLNTLDFSNNQFSGRIPETIGNLSQLVTLYLYNNALTDSLPSELGNLSNLQNLYMYGNNFEGEIPSSLGNLNNIMHLWLSDNQFEGALPVELSNLSNLQSFSIYSNNISGPVPSEYSMLSALNSFYILLNRFTFADILSVPSWFNGAGFVYSPQQNIDNLDTLLVDDGNQLVLTANIDRNTEPKCKYQWFKDGEPLHEADTANHTLIIDYATEVDAGDYHYIITNDSLPSLTLSSQVKTVDVIPCTTTRQQQIDALIQLYELTNRGDTTWTNNNWKIAGVYDTANVENWYGVLFNVEGDVETINLANNNLIGELSQWDKVADLCQLKEIVFQSDSLYGDLSQWDISMLTKLERLNLYYNRLSGNINDWIVPSMVNLNYINLTLNRFSGDITQFDFNAFANLAEVHVGSNQLSGSLGSWNPNSQSVHTLVVSGNSLSGPIESLQLSGMSNLASLNLSANAGINGDISQFNVSVVPQLLSLNLSSCNIAGDITLWNLDSLEYLDYLALGNNEITGYISNFDLSSNLNLRSLYLYTNQLTGCLADWDINYLTKLEMLYLYGNAFNCDVTSWDICGLVSLRYLNLQNTGLTGNIQDWNINCVTSLYYLNLGINSFEGQIDLWDISSLSGLYHLYINNNQIAGNIDGWNIAGLSSLRYLYAYNNAIGGQIHQWAVNSLTNLVNINLMNNAIEGDLGQWDISQWGNISTININNNNISGDISAWQIGTLANLGTLSAENNDVTGDITQCGIENLTNLVTLDFDNNSLHGDITNWNIGSLTKLQTLGLDSSRLSGTIDSIDFKNLTALQNLHLTGSKIYGNLDSAGIANFGNLTSLKLNGNNFTGNLNSWPQAAGMNTIQIDSNAFTFTGLLPFVLNASVPNLSYAAQDSVDVERNIYAIPGDANLVTEIDIDTSPSSKFQWYKDGIAISTLDIYNYDYELEMDQSSYGTYHYIITNDAVPGLVLTSRPITLLLDTSFISYNFCIEYDTENPSYLENFTYEVDLDAAVAECLVKQQERLDTIVYYLKEKLIEEKLSSIYSTYKTNCIGNVTETFNYSYVPKEYHYTLYYYDQAGNLVQTVPPKGVKPNADGEPTHELITRYKYNSLNQLIWQSTPDGGETNFWYDRKGQLRFSQNAEQLQHDKYSYTRYDGLGRIVEVGELLHAGLLDDLLVNLDSAHYPEAQLQELNDITYTIYDVPASDSLISSGFWQHNLRSRVSYVMVKETEESDTVATYYSYDAHGNVNTLLQQIPGLGEKRTDYVYDLISGNVNYVMYQFGESDQFMHRYQYDADNRLLEVETSHDGYTWNKDAKYYYYPHGPLSRIELGEYNVQGLDYYYTLQGWLKGVNMPVSGDPGEDGSLIAMTGKDEFAFQLGYYDGDYSPIGTGIIDPGARDRLWSNYNSMQNTGGLYNGNIAWMATQLPEAGRRNDDGEKQGYQAMLYHYDQLNRIMAANSLTSYTTASGFGSRSAANEAYDTRYSYDPNGNLLTLQRYNLDGTIFHDYNYQYYAGTNRLQKVQDEYVEPVYNSKTYNTNPLVPDGEKYKYITLDSGAVVPTGSTVDLGATQRIVLKPGTKIESGATFTAAIVEPDTIVIPPEGQYLYDQIGNLVRDNGEKVTISWTPYGKVRSVTKDNGDVINFAYDAAGNRVEKAVTTADTTFTTHYLRDASGNVMATYTNTKLKEQPIYGSNRLGMYHGGTQPGQELLGNKNYELTNHLGNVLAVVTDNINIDDTEVTASAASVSDYYPFGLGMDGRTFSSGDYRYGFNGKEKDQNGEFGNTHYDYGFRIYNPDIGKFLSVDPLTSSYPMLTPYQFASNSPITGIDLDGLEYLDYREAKVEIISGTPFIKLENFSEIYQNKFKRENPYWGYTFLNTDGTARGDLMIGDGSIFIPDPKSPKREVTSLSNDTNSPFYKDTKVKLKGVNRAAKRQNARKGAPTITTGPGPSGGAAAITILINAINFSYEFYINKTLMDDQSALSKQVSDRKYLQVNGFFDEELIIIEAPLNKALKDLKAAMQGPNPIIPIENQNIDDLSAITNIILFGGNGKESEELQQIGNKIIDDICKCRREDNNDKN